MKNKKSVVSQDQLRPSTDRRPVEVDKSFEINGSMSKEFHGAGFGKEMFTPLA